MVFLPFFSVLTYCHIHKLNAVLYMCYTDSIHLDFATLKTFQPLIESTPVKYMREVRGSNSKCKLIDYVHFL